MRDILCLLGFAGVIWLMAYTNAALKHEIEKCKIVQMSQQKMLDKLTQERKP